MSYVVRSEVSSSSRPSWGGNCCLRGPEGDREHAEVLEWETASLMRLMNSVSAILAFV